MKDSLKNRIKPFIPEAIRRFVSGIHYGWHGNYETWQDALSQSSGYDSPHILEKVRNSAFLVREGRAAYERDSVLFSNMEYSYELLSMLMWVAARKGGRLNVMDFGGSLGSTFFQNRKFIESLHEIHWCIVEQPGFVETGKKYFETDILRFYHSIEECTSAFNIDIALFSSVLQYIELPFEILEKVAEQKIEYLLIDRTPFTDKPDRITIQKVPPSIYSAVYPCWFFNKDEFISRVPRYSLLNEFKSLDRSNIRSEFLGMLFVLNKN